MPREEGREGGREAKIPSGGGRAPTSLPPERWEEDNTFDGLGKCWAHHDSPLSCPVIN